MATSALATQSGIEQSLDVDKMSQDSNEEAQGYQAYEQVIEAKEETKNQEEVKEEEKEGQKIDE